VEDADALLDAIHQGLAQHTPEDLALYSGSRSAIRMPDADRAEVQYMLLHDGQPQFGLRTGTGGWRAEPTGVRCCRSVGSPARRRDQTRERRAM
jgi:hypothetical protein